jgi:maltokinase
MTPTAAALTGRLATELGGLLVTWLPEQRWYGDKGEKLESVILEAAVRLRDGDEATDAPALWHVIALAGKDEHTARERAQRYQLLIGVRRELPDRLTHAAIGVLDGTALSGEDPEGLGGAEDLGTAEAREHLGTAVAYDATHDPELTRWLLERFLAQDEIGSLSFHLVPGVTVPGVDDLDALSSLVLTGEQSNTSLVYGNALILKMFRRLVAGTNPDLELALALSRASSRHIAQPMGWLETTLPDDTSGTRPATTLAILQEFLPTATDGWVLAQTSVRDLYADPATPAAEAGGDFAPEAYRLGAATADVHRDLAATLPVEHLTGERLRELAALMRRRLDAAVRTVPVLEEYAPALRTAIDEIALLDHPLIVQRIHGDYHLGQVMRTPTAWVLLDFEGEPAKPLAERRALSSPLRDVAAMLRSFDYAAHHLLATIASGAGTEIDPLLVERGREWARRNRDAFCAGYAEESGHDPRDETVVLRAFEIDKAVYEVKYEVDNRPAWASIPLGAVRRLAAR